ncbi:hypothetical protein JXR93_08050 [bacterium]|nr:hypothetical protein [bacterium]
MNVIKEEIEKIKLSLEFVKKNSELKLKDISVDDFEAQCNDLFDSIDKIDDIELELFDLKKKRDKLLAETSSVSSRIRKLVAGYYGEDSKEIKELGLKAKSDYKKPSKSKKRVEEDAK